MASLSLLGLVSAGATAIKALGPGASFSQKEQALRGAFKSKIDLARASAKSSAPKAKSVEKPRKKVTQPAPRRAGAFLSQGAQVRSRRVRGRRSAQILSDPLG